MEVSPRLGSVGQCPWQVLRRKVRDLHLVDTLSRDRRLGLDAGLSGGRGKVTPQGLVSSGEQIEQCAAPPVLRTPVSRSGWHIELVQGRDRLLGLVTDAVRGRRMTTFADSMMSPIMSMWPKRGSFCRACDSPMPIEESAIAGQKIGTLARNAAVRIPSRPVVFQRWPPS